MHLVTAHKNMAAKKKAKKAAKKRKSAKRA